MGKVPANALRDRVCLVGNACRAEVFISERDVRVDEVADRLDAAPSERGGSENAPRLLGQAGLAVATSQQELQRLAGQLQPAIDAAKTRSDRRQGTLARLWADFVEVKAAAQQGTFVPDANRTLRLTFGRVRTAREIVQEALDAATRPLPTGS